MEQQQLCLNCDKPLVNIEGRKAKKYCDNKCRARHWTKNHTKKAPQWVKKELYEAVVKERDEMALYLKQIGMDDWKWDNRLVETVLMDEPEMPSDLDPNYFNKAHKKAMAKEFDRLVVEEKKVPVIKDKVANKPIESKPVKGKNESGIDFSIRVSEWEANQKK